MAEIKRVNGRPTIDYMARDYDSLLQAMRALIPEKLPEWTDYESQADFGNVLLQLFAHMGDILSYYQDRVANEGFLGTAQQRRSVIQQFAPDRVPTLHRCTRVGHPDPDRPRRHYRNYHHRPGRCFCQQGPGGCTARTFRIHP